MHARKNTMEIALGRDVHRLIETYVYSIILEPHPTAVMISDYYRLDMPPLIRSIQFCSVCGIHVMFW